MQTIHIHEKKLAEFCQRWRITELALFGSVLRDDFRPESDIDVLVRFEHDAPWSLFDFMHAEEELSQILGRKVDLVEQTAVEKSKNPIRREAILNSARVIYVAES